MIECMYRFFIAQVPIWAKGEVVGEDDGKLIVKVYTPFNVEGFVEFEVDKEDVIIL